MLLKEIKGIGPKTLKELNNEGIFNAKDLILSFPKDYLIFEHDPSKILEANTYLEGVVDSSISYFKYKKNVFAFSFYLKYDNVRVKMNIFSNIYVGIKIKQGDYIGVYGKYNNIKKVFNIKRLFLNNVGAKIEADYKYKNINNNKMTSIISEIINEYKFEETLPLELIEKYRLLNINDYIYLSHFPKSRRDVIEILRRRKYEEFYWYSLSLSYIRYKRKALAKPKRVIDGSLYLDILNKLPYPLTVDQNQAIIDIINDLKSDYPMNRLIQGDVGCGKTILAIISGLLMVKAGFQVAMLAPTEVLAIQEYNEFSKILKDYNINISLLTASVKGNEYNKIIKSLNDGTINIIIGTHSLLNDKVTFKNLGLAIIDEQHRFGVNQRLKLVNKYENVDSMFFSATPIPRTLGLTFFKDLDISSIKSMPAGRKKVITKVVPFKKLTSLFKSIENHISLDEKCYVVVPIIENEEDEDIMDIFECEELFKNRFNNRRIGILHGKMKNEDKNRVLDDFKNGLLDILISTTVIEVGVNIKEATMMIIMNSERFGISTLHQLRGRVGRGDKESYCMLVSDDIENPRLKALEETTDGFEIAEMDYSLRGPGDYLGLNQSGFNSLKYSSFSDDIKILECARDDSTRLINKYISGEIKSRKFDNLIEREIEIDKIN